MPVCLDRTGRRLVARPKDPLTPHHAAASTHVYPCLSALPPNRMASPSAGSSEHPFHFTFHDYCGRWGGRPCNLLFPHRLTTNNARVDSPPWRIGEGSPVCSNFLLCTTCLCEKYMKVSVFRIPQSTQNLSSPASSFHRHSPRLQLSLLGLTEPVCHPHRLCSVLHSVSDRNFGPSHHLVQTSFQKAARRTQKEKIFRRLRYPQPHPPNTPAGGPHLTVHYYPGLVFFIRPTP